MRWAFNTVLFAFTLLQPLAVEAPRGAHASRVGLRGGQPHPSHPRQSRTKSGQRAIPLAKGHDLIVLEAHRWYGLALCQPPRGRKCRYDSGA